MSSPKSNAEQNIGEMRAKIETLKSERRATEIAPRSRGEALGLIDQHVQVMGQANGINIERFTSAGFTPGSNQITRFDSLEEALCAVAPEQMREFLRTELMVHLEGKPQGVSDATRAKTIERLDREIRDLEISEEDLILRMEADGAEVDRRGDMDPAVFLEVTSEDAAA